MAETGNTEPEKDPSLEPLHITDITSKPSRIKLLHRCRPLFGIYFAILSALMLVLNNLFAKLCVVLPVFEIGVIRFIIQLVITIPPLIYSNDKVVFTPKITILLGLRGFVGTCSMITRFYAVKNMPLGDATVLLFTTPVFVVLLARIFLKERLHLIYSILLLLCLAGVTLIARPTFIFGHSDTVSEYKDTVIPSLVAVLSAIFTASSMITVRALLVYKMKSNVILLYFGLVGLVYSVLGSYFDRGFQFPFCQSLDYFYAVCVGCFAQLTQLFLIEALRYDKAFIVSLGRSSGIVFGFVFQVLIYSLVPSSLSFGGAAMITLCNIIIFIFNWYQYKKNSPAESSTPNNSDE